MNDKKICFIMCVNNEMYEEECLYYINHLVIPNGYEIDVISIKEAKSMTEGYNAAMVATDAKYKIYMHQDVFLVKSDFIQDMLDVFSNPEVGMIGMVGAEELSKDGCMWNGDKVGRIYSSNIVSTQLFVASDKQNKPYTEVEAVDGLFIATQYDVKWREDIFDGWDFYDISQSEEFHRAGYKVVVPYMDKPWCLHDDGILNLGNYDKYRQIFLKEYKR